ncbi:MAG: hypothetical protein PHI24_13205 [Desulfitobacteriaceae bacterium]|nr:hypothetical protein [Desulfitobacteriaceae bacterium]
MMKSLMQDLNEKGIELTEYHEPAALRYLFETVYRDALAKASLSLICLYRSSELQNELTKSVIVASLR